MDKLILQKIISDQIQDADLTALSELDWGLLIRDAQVQGVGSLIYWPLSNSGKISFVPESVRNNLRVIYSNTWLHNNKILSELEVLTSSLNKADISAVVLKGACFALTIYPDIGLRPMGDLDLLVPKSKIKQAADIAANMGYVDFLPDASPGLRDLINNEICLKKDGKPSIILELHKSLVADKSFVYAAPVDWFWEQTELVRSKQQYKFENLLMLTPTAQLLFAAAHAILQHGGEQAPLRWFYDIHLLIVSYRERIDWKLLLTQAGLFEWTSALSVALSKTRDYFETPIPENVLQALESIQDRHQNLVALKMSKPETHILLERQKLLSLNWYGRFRLVLANLIPTPAYMRWRYKIKTFWLLPWYYIVRWLGILRDGFYTLIVLLMKG